MKFYFRLLLLGLSIAVVANAWAEEGTLAQVQQRLEQLEQKYQEQTRCLDEQRICLTQEQEKVAAHEQKLKQVDETLHRQTGEPVAIGKDLDVALGATLILQSAQPQLRRTDATLTYDVMFSRKLPDLGGEIFMNAEAGRGTGVDDGLNLFSLVNYDAADDSRLHVSELWYEQSLSGLLICMGLVDPTVYFDVNEVASDETTQFLSAMFRNNSTLDFLHSVLGLRMIVAPYEWLNFGYGVFVGQEDWHQIGKRLLQLGQIVVQGELLKEKGHLRIWGWQNQGEHTRWMEPDQTRESSWGYGLSVDHTLGRDVLLFARWGRCDGSVYLNGTGFSLEQAWSAGASVRGETWGRSVDTLGVAVGQMIPSEAYLQAGYMQEPVRRAELEGHAEVYYRWVLHAHLALSPDVQYVWNPYGLDHPEATEGIWVFGLRAQVDF